MDLAEESAADHHHDTRRRICTGGCDRPKNVCLCHTLPSPPLSTTTEVVILHHPHERRHKLATVPLLSKCLRNCQIIVGRKLKYGHSKLLDSLHDRAVDRNSDSNRALYLFPGANALRFTELSRPQVNSSCDGTGMNLILIVFDGTWNHAREMMLASLPFLSKFAYQVCLDFDAGVHGGTKFDSELILRKEPYAGCMSTMEAVARCLRVLEPNGVEIELKIIEVLRVMVKFQACFLKPPNSQQNKLVKNNQSNHKSNESIGS